MPTGVVPLGSELKRKKWMREGLVQAASKSFWNPLTRQDKTGVVFQAKNESAGDGHTVVFDFDGNLSGRAIKGKDTAFGKGEQKRKFSDKITVQRYRLVVDNGDKFDGIDIGDLSINEHTDSRAKLGDLFVRFKDQAIFDASQGNLVTESDGAAQAPTHVIDLGATFTYNQLLDIEHTLRTSQGFSTGTIRRPLDPFLTKDGEPLWIYIADASMLNVLRQDSAFQTVMRSADVRGEQNRLLRGVVGKIGHLLIVQADQFFGSTEGSATGWGLDSSNIEIAGMRQYDGTNPATALWTGQEGFDYASTDLHSRGLICGQAAVQIAFGKQPDYKWKPSQDFDIKSESALEVWMETRKTRMKAENSDYKQAKVADIDFGIVAVDLKVG